MQCSQALQLQAKLLIATLSNSYATQHNARPATGATGVHAGWVRTIGATRKPRGSVSACFQSSMVQMLRQRAGEPCSSPWTPEGGWGPAVLCAELPQSAQ